MAQRFNYPVEFDQSNSTGLKNSYKTAEKTNVEPGMATYWYNSMLYKFLNPNYAWHNDFTTRSNSTGRIRPASKTAIKWHKKQMLSLIWMIPNSTREGYNEFTPIFTSISCPVEFQIRPVEFDQSNWE